MPVLIVALAASAALHAERQPLDRYQSIVERQMFGALPPGFDPTKPPSAVSAKEEREKEQELTKEQEQVKSSVHFSVINVTPAGETAVGFTDNSDAKSPKHYYLKVGETRDGWMVKEADPLAATMTICKGDIEVSLELGGNSANNAGATKGGGGSGGGMNGGRSRFGMFNRGGGGGQDNGASGALGSLRDRRNRRERQREQEMQQLTEERKRLAEERAADKRQREEERAEEERRNEEQRNRLLEIQEELRRTREEAKARENAAAAQGGSEPGDNGGNPNEQS